MAFSLWRWAAVLIVGLPVCAQETELSKRKTEKDNPRARAEFIHRQRGRAEGGMSAAELRRQAIEQRDAMIREQGDRWRRSLQAADRSSSESGAGTTPETSNAIPISSSTWTEIGPKPTKTRFGASSGFYQSSSGRVTALAVDPCDSTGNTAYLGAAQGGVWKTVDGGTSWSPLTDSQASLAIGSIAVFGTPGNCLGSVVYVGTGEQSFSSDSYYGAGILKSTNGGTSWTLLTNPAFDGTNRIFTATGVPGLPTIGAVAIQPGNANVVLAAVESQSPGVYRTLDGTNFAATSITSTATAAAFAPNDGNVAFVGVMNGGVFRTANATNPAGPTFTNISASTSGLNVGRVALAVFSKDIVYAVVSNDPTGTAFTVPLSGIFKTTNASSATPTWTNLTANLTGDFCTPQCWYDLAVAVNPLDSNQVFVGGAATDFLQRTTNGGASWTDETGLPGQIIHVDQHAMAFSADGTKLYIGNDGGVYRTINPGNNGSIQWEDLNGTLNIAQFYKNFALHPNDENQVLGGTQDNSIQYFSGLLQWNDVTCGDGAGAVIDPVTPSTAYANCQNVDVRRSTNLSLPGSYGPADNGISVVESTAFIPPLIGDGVTSGRLYFGGSKVWKSNDGGQSNWTAISGNLPAVGEYITALATVPANTNIVWAGTSDGRIWRGTSTGSFISLSTGVGSEVRAITLDPNDPTGNIVVVAQAGFTTRRLSRSTNAASSTPLWSDISSNLPAVPVNDIVIDPDIPNTLYAATDLGVYFSSNNGTTWAPLANGLPNVAVFGLKLHRPSRTLRAATHGRGMWDLFVPFTVNGAGGRLQPGGLSFASTSVGSTSGTQTLTFTNIGTATTTISRLDNQNPNEFPIVVNACVGTIPPNGTCTIQVAFRPQTAGARSSTVTVVSNAVNTSGLSSTLSGTGVIAPSNDLFANAKIVGRLNYFDTLTINDSTTTNLDSSDPFPDSGLAGCVAATGDGRYHTVWYRYTPAQPGTVLIETTGSDYDTVVSVWTGSPGALSEMGCADDIVPGTQRQSRLQFDANAGTTYNVMVAGYYPEEQGTLQFSMYGPASSTPPVVNVSPSPLNFAPRAVGTVSAAQTLTFTFPNGTVNKIAANITGDYSFSTTCNVIQSQLSSCTADIVFAPIAPGARNGTFTITSDASNSPLNVPLSGTASAASVTLTPANGQFIGVVGSPTLAQAFTFSNNSGAPIIVSNVSTSGDFGKNSNCANVPNGGSCNISVTMIASQVGSRIGSLTVTHNGPGGSTAVNLAGTGVDFNLGLARPTRSHRPPGPIAIRAGQRKNVDVVLSSTVPIEQDVVLQCTAPKGLTCALSDSLATLRSGQTAISANIRVVPSRRLPTQLSRTIVVSITAQAGQVSRTLEIPVLLVNSPLRLR